MAAIIFGVLQKHSKIIFLALEKRRVRRNYLNPECQEWVFVLSVSLSQSLSLTRSIRFLGVRSVDVCFNSSMCVCVCVCVICVYNLKPWSFWQWFRCTLSSVKQNNRKTGKQIKLMTSHRMICSYVLLLKLISLVVSLVFLYAEELHCSVTDLSLVGKSHNINK